METHGSSEKHTLKNLVAISNEATINFDLSHEDTISVDTTKDLNVYRKIARCGLAIEHTLKTGHSTSIARNELAYNMAGIVWKDTSIWYTPQPWAEHIRGNEIVVHTLNTGFDLSWIMGHPRAITKLAACCIDLDRDVDLPHGVPHTPAVKLLWLANRIGMHVYGLH